MIDIINTILYIWNIYDIWWLIAGGQQRGIHGLLTSPSWDPERGSATPHNLNNCHAAEIYQCHFTAGFKYSRMKHILNANLYTIQAIQQIRTRASQITVFSNQFVKGAYMQSYFWWIFEAFMYACPASRSYMFTVVGPSHENVICQKQLIYINNN